MNKLITPIFFAFALLANFVLPQNASADIKVKKGDSIAFMGDSITQAGNRKNGYINLVIEALNQEGLNVEKIPAGKSGHKSSNMLARLDTDVISKNPDWMTLSCGVNDVWHFKLVLGDRTFEGITERNSGCAGKTQQLRQVFLWRRV